MATASPPVSADVVSGGSGEFARSPRSRKGLVIWVTLALATGVVVSMITLSRRGKGARYITAKVDRGDINSTITTTGNLNAVITVQVGSQVSGNIIALYADFNTKVTKG